MSRAVARLAHALMSTDQLMQLLSTTKVMPGAVYHQGAAPTKAVCLVTPHVSAGIHVQALLHDLCAVSSAFPAL